MPAIVKTDKSGIGSRTLIQTTLDASNSFVYEPGLGSLLILRNPTASSINSNIDGNGGTSVNVAGIGAVSVAAGLTIPVPAGAAVIIPLDTIHEYLRGAISVTGVGLVASLVV